MHTHMLIDTGVDKLLRLVNDKQEISLQKAAKELGVPASILESWADSLEEAGSIMIKLTFREKFLISVNADAPQAKNGSFLQNMLPLNTDFGRRAGKSLDQKEKGVNAKLALLDKKLCLLKEYEKLLAEVKTEKEQFHREKGEMYQMKAQLDKEIKGYMKDKEQFAKEQMNFKKQQLAFSEESESFAKRVKILLKRESQLTSNQKKFDRALEKMKRSVSESVISFLPFDDAS